MPYVTGVERRALARGREAGREAGLVDGIAWLPDSSGMFLQARARDMNLRGQIKFQPYPSGPVQNVRSWWKIASTYLRCPSVLGRIVRPLE